MRVFLRLALVAAVAIAVGASASSSQQQHPAVGTYTTAGAPPPSQPMDPAAALGLWKSSFGPVKVELDRSGEEQGAGEARLMGVWVYDRAGQEVIGFFAGPLEGNVLHFDWEEPTDGEPLRGSGYLVFEGTGGSFSGRWWTEARDRGGEWTGWRPGTADPAADPGYDPNRPPEPGYGDPSAPPPGPGYGDPSAPPPDPGYDPGYGDPSGPPPDPGYGGY